MFKMIKLPEGTVTNLFMTAAILFAACQVTPAAAFLTTEFNHAIEPTLKILRTDNEIYEGKFFLPSENDFLLTLFFPVTWITAIEVKEEDGFAHLHFQSSDKFRDTLQKTSSNKPTFSPEALPYSQTPLASNLSKLFLSMINERHYVQKNTIYLVPLLANPSNPDEKNRMTIITLTSSISPKKKMTSCPNCPTVILDSIQKEIVPDKNNFYKPAAYDVKSEDTTLWRMPARKVTYMLDHIVDGVSMTLKHELLFTIRGNYLFKAELVSFESDFDGAAKTLDGILTSSELRPISDVPTITPVETTILPNTKINKNLPISIFQKNVPLSIKNGIRVTAEKATLRLEIQKPAQKVIAMHISDETNINEATFDQSNLTKTVLREAYPLVSWGKWFLISEKEQIARSTSNKTAIQNSSKITYEIHGLSKEDSGDCKIEDCTSNNLLIALASIPVNRSGAWQTSKIEYSYISIVFTSTRSLSPPKK